MTSPAEQRKTLTRREMRRSERREAILTIAANSFFERGYAASTMSSIAARLGGSKSTLWNYFPNKGALFEAVVEQKVFAYREKLLLLFDDDGSLEHTLRSFCSLFIERVTTPSALTLHRLVHAEAGRFPEMGEIYFDSAPGMIQRKLADYLALQMDRGILPNDDAMLAARTLITQCMAGCYHQLLVGRLEATNPELIKADVDHAMLVFRRTYT
jgi:TetR/AcrR family transcriptional repressor of mexJK operon